MNKKACLGYVGKFVQTHPMSWVAFWFCVALLVPLLFHEPALALYRSDTFEYLRGAESLFTGNGYLASNGSAQTLFPPGYSAAIAILKLIIPATPTAAVVVSLLASATSVVLVYLIANAWLGWQSAMLAGILFAFYPLRVWLAQSALSESLEVMLALAGIYFLSSGTSLFRSVAGGICLGLAYLTRPEALAIILVLGLAICLLALTRKREWKRLGLALVFAVLTVVPYLFWFQAQTGTWSFSGKSNVIKLGLLRAQTKSDIEWRLLNDTQTEIKVPEPDFSLQSMAAHYTRNVWQFKERLVANTGFAPLSGFLLIWGMLTMLLLVLRRRAWSIGMFQIALLAPLFIFPLFWVEDRFVYQIMPVLVWWIGLGLVALHEWIQQNEIGIELFDTLLGHAIIAIFLTFMLGSFIFRLGITHIDADQIEVSKQVAALLSDLASDKNIGIISEYPAIAYFANGRNEFTPNSNLDGLRRFALAKKTPYIVITSDDVHTIATRQLLEGNYLPDAAKRLGEVRQGDLKLILFYLYPQVP